MKKRSFVPGLVALVVGFAAGAVAACNSNGSSTDPDGAAGSDSASPSGGDGSGGLPDGAGGGDSPGASGDRGVAGEGGATGEGGTTGAGAAGPGGAGEAGSGSLGEAGAAGSSTAGALPEGTFLYVYSQTADHDLLIARDFVSGEERVVTDLKGDGSDGWEIWGHAISPDRTRIALASLYAPTDADVATGLATRRIYTLDIDGSDFQRLTPVSPNTGGGRMNFTISIDDPAFSVDGKNIIYEMGNYWYESTSLKGGTKPWYVATSGDELPGLFPADASCSIVSPSVNPATGDVLLVHSVCLSSVDEGIFLYPIEGGAPTKLVAKAYGAGFVDPSLEKASWLADGSGFLFVATTELLIGANTETVRALFLYDMTSGDITRVVTPELGTTVRNGAIAPNASAIVYCLAHDGGLDLHAIDLTAASPVDVPITTDGKSCSPGF